MTDQPGARTTAGPEDVAAAEALAALTRAKDHVEAARQHAYEFHRLVGDADATLLRAAHLLRDAGHQDLADLVHGHLVGRGVADDRWTFEVDETHDDDFHRTLVMLQDRLHRHLGDR